MNAFDAFFQDAPAAVDVPAVRRDWQALNGAYNVNQWLLPLPPWAKRPYEHAGGEAWRLLQTDLAQNDSESPMCIYLHAPFCSSKCGFCDCYSFKLGARQREHIQQYVDRLCYELCLWSALGSLKRRPIASVHLGGGTPTFLGAAALEQLADCCKAHFNITPTTEWALESNSTALTPEVIDAMHRIGYRRLHLGVQTLQDPVRSTIGRRRSAADMLQKIETTLALGWVVSVDLICGLPGQTLAGFIAGLQALLAAGIDGVSLYELLIYPQNYKWARRHGLTERGHESNFWMFVAGAHLLEAHGLRKNLFNHWAGARDANVYFTFPQRGEDLLAVGTIADGVFGDYHYRHPRYTPYMETALFGAPGLQGGLRRNPLEERVKPLATPVLSGRLSAEIARAIEAQSGLVTRWQAFGLLRADAAGGFWLTPSGSWFAGNMVAEVTAALAEPQPA